MTVVFEEIERSSIKLLNENIIKSLTDVADSLLAKAAIAEEADKTRLVAKVSGIQHVKQTYGDQLTHVTTFEEARKILNAIHSDFQKEESEPVARGMDIAGITILGYIN